MPIDSRKMGSLLRRPAARSRIAPNRPDRRGGALPRPEWMSEAAFRDLENACADAVARRGHLMPPQEIRAEFDLDAFTRPAWMSPEAFRRFKQARAQLLSGGGREMTADELRAEFGLEPG